MTVQELFSIHIYHGYIFQILLAELLFVRCFKPRNHFWIRCLLSMGLYLLSSLVITNLLNQVVSGFSSITIFVISFFCLLICFGNKMEELLFWCVGAQLLQNLSHNIENLIYLPLSDHFNNLGWFFLSLGVMIVVYALSYFVITKYTDIKKGVSLSGSGIFPLAIASALFCYLIQFLLQVYKIDSIWVTRLPLVFTDIIALLLQFGLLGYKNKIDENAYLEKLINQSDNYYQVVKENIDLLNMKAHDLKHFIRDFRNSGNLSQEDLNALQSAVEKYESSPLTGNKTLDTVLNEKAYICHKKNIPFYIMAKENLLCFIKPADMTSLFGNLLSNAIECEDGIQDETKRFILLKIAKKGQIISIHVENYCDTVLHFDNGLPVSTKGDNRFHGFGLKSVEYIVKKYDGNARIHQENSIFSVDIIFPEKEDK